MVYLIFMAFLAEVTVFVFFLVLFYKTPTILAAALFLANNGVSEFIIFKSYRINSEQIHFFLKKLAVFVIYSMSVHAYLF